MPRKRSVSIHGHQTSYSVEDEFHEELTRLARERNIPLARLITEIDTGRQPQVNLSSAIRLFILKQLKSELRSLSVFDNRRQPVE